MGGGASAVAITNWQEMASPLETGFEGGLNSVWLNNQANAGQWTQAVLQAQNDDRTQRDKALTAWKDQNESFQLKWAVAQAAMAAAQIYLADKALEAAKDAAAKQYDIANRQQTIAESEYARYSAHFAPCENKTIDEECARPEYVEDIEAEINKAVVDVRKQFSIQRKMAERRRQRYCVGPFLAAQRQLDIEEARAVAEAKEKARRFLEERQESRRDKFFNRKLQLFNIGRNIKADAVGELAKSAAGISRGTDIELAARNQFYGAIMSSLGGVIGAALPNSGVPQTGFGSMQGGRSGGSIGGFSSGTGFGGMPDVGTNGYGTAGYDGTNGFGGFGSLG